MYIYKTRYQPLNYTTLKLNVQIEYHQKDTTNKVQLAYWNAIRILPKADCSGGMTAVVQVLWHLACPKLHTAALLE